MSSSSAAQPQTNLSPHLAMVSAAQPAPPLAETSPAAEDDPAQRQVQEGIVRIVAILWKIRERPSFQPSSLEGAFFKLAEMALQAVVARQTVAPLQAELESSKRKKDSRAKIDSAQTALTQANQAATRAWQTLLAAWRELGVARQAAAGRPPAPKASQ